MKSLLRRRKQAAEPSDLVVPYWQWHDEELLSAGLLTMARRLQIGRAHV